MEPPTPPPSTTPLFTATHLAYPDSVDSSPRSRNADSWDEPFTPNLGPKLRLMCSYGGHIVPRPHDKFLCYVGGETRIVVVDRHSSLSDLSSRLSHTLFNGRSFTLKYQLPNEDLDSLISVTTDEDFENMIEEYDRNSTSLKRSRLRLFLFPSKSDSSSSIGSLLDESKTENWFVDALNGAGNSPSGLSADSSSVNCLLGLDDTVNIDSTSVVDLEARPESLVNSKKVKQGQDVHSVPDSPLLENNSSFGSASSSPFCSNLPPIRVHVEKIGLEEPFSLMNMDTTRSAASASQKQDEGFVVLSSPASATIAAATPVPSVTINSIPLATENPNWVFSGERSDHGAPIMFQKSPQPQPQPQPQPPPMQHQFQQKPSGVLDLPTPDSISRDINVPYPISHPKPVFYQDPVLPITSKDTRVSVNSPADPKTSFSDQNHRTQMQNQVQDSGYGLPPQLLHPSTHYIHHQATGSIPISSYYPIYPTQQQQQQQNQNQLEQQYPMYFMPVRQNQPYNFSMQSNVSDISGRPAPSSVHAPVPSTAAYKESPALIFPTRTPPAKPEFAGNAYRAASTAPIVYLSPDQNHQQYMGYHQMHHQSQSMATSATNFPYEYIDQTHARVYYAQGLPPQYQTMNVVEAAVVSEASTQVPAENYKQMRTSQP